MIRRALVTQSGAVFGGLLAAWLLALGLLFVPTTHAQERSGVDVRALGARLESDSVEVRRNAASRLGATGLPEAVPYLLPGLRDREEIVRATVAGALGRIGDRSAVGHLSERLANEKKTFVRRTIAYALGEIGDPLAVRHLVARLEREKEEEVRSAIATALGEIASVEAVPALLERLRDKDDFVRREAIRALGLIGDRRAVDPVARALEVDESADVRRHAAEALGRLGGPAARAPLNAATRDEDPYVVAEAFRALELLDAAR